MNAWTQICHTILAQEGEGRQTGRDSCQNGCEGDERIDAENLN